GRGLGWGVGEAGGRRARIGRLGGALEERVQVRAREIDDATDAAHDLFLDVLIASGGGGGGIVERARRRAGATASPPTPGSVRVRGLRRHVMSFEIRSCECEVRVTKTTPMPGGDAWT